MREEPVTDTLDGKQPQIQEKVLRLVARAFTATPHRATDRRLIAAAGLACVLIAFALLVRVAPDSAAESSLMDWLRARNFPLLRELMESVSRLTGNPIVVLAPFVAVCMFVTGRRRDARLFVAVAALVAVAIFAVDYSLGEIAGRGRPLPFETRPSYPSGHTSGSTWIFIFLMYLVSRSAWHDLAKGWVIGVLGTLVVMVGFSRIFLHRHWPIDIVGGYALGILGAIVAIWLFEYVRARGKELRPAGPERDAGLAGGLARP